MNFNFIPLCTISIILLLIPTTMAFGQTNPWGLFQQLCPTGRLATGPQCQNFFTNTNLVPLALYFRMAYVHLLQILILVLLALYFRMAYVHLLQHLYRQPRSLMLVQIKQLPQLWVLLLHWLVQEVLLPQVVLL